ncbi:MAG: radical SAM protein [Candidatus Omnitrophota bacterium]
MKKIIKKTLLIQPPSRSSLDFGGSLKKNYGGHELELGLLYIAAFLEEKGIGVTFLDMSLYDDAERRLIDILGHNTFDFIGITAYTNSIKAAGRVAEVIKKKSEAKIVIGGAHASALPLETLDAFRDFDYLVYGEGEKTFTQLVMEADIPNIKGLVWRDEGEIVQNPPQDPVEDLNALPFPARHLLDFDKYIPPPGNYYKLPSTGILSSRGCPFLCTYCSRTGTRFKNSVRLRSVESIIDEIKFCIKNYGIYDFRFYDDVFVVPKKRLIKFCQALMDENIKITWNCYSRVDTMDKDMLSLMRRTGCYHIKYGVEFGTDKWLIKTKKGTTLEDAKRALKETKKIGIAAKASFMIGMPGETVSEIRETINFAKELNPTYTTFGIFTPLPGSELFDEAKENGTLLTRDYDSYFNKSKKILRNQLELAELEKMLKKAYKDIYFNPRFFLHRIMHLIKNPTLYEIGTLIKGFSILLNK